MAQGSANPALQLERLGCREGRGGLLRTAGGAAWASERPDFIPGGREIVGTKMVSWDRALSLTVLVRLECAGGADGPVAALGGMRLPQPVVSNQHPPRFPGPGCRGASL